MGVELLIILLVIVVGFVVLGFFVKSWISGSQQKPDELISQILKSVDSRSLEQTREIREQTKNLNDRLDNAARVISAVQKNIGEFTEIGRNMQELQAFLRSPKLRGTIGEEVLADLIRQLFPASNYFLQYQFKTGVRVDAAIKTDAGLLPIDAKFPMENFQKMMSEESEIGRSTAKREFIRDIKRHIEAISQKYILPSEGTLDFALMYVPSESVYYELVQSTEVTTFARRARVYAVSPTTLYAHLQVILLSYAGKQLETKTREVFQLLRAMQGDFDKIDGSFSVLGKHITNAYNQVGQVQQNLSQIGQKIKQTQQIEHMTKPKQLEIE